MIDLQRILSRLKFATDGAREDGYDWPDIIAALEKHTAACADGAGVTDDEWTPFIGETK